MKRSLATGASIALSFFSALAAAQAIKDPTRPPTGFGAPAEPSSAEAPSGGPVLQSVMLSPTRRAAIISGQVVARGENYGDAVLAEVAEDHVILRRGAGYQVLKMYPGAEKSKVVLIPLKPAPRKDQTK
jgi:MSHA biogenesis protein MshK